MNNKDDIQELLNSMQELLNKGFKVSEAEKELGFGDGYVRKKLSKEGYKFDRKTNKYVHKEQELVKAPTVTRSNGMLQDEVMKKSNQDLKLDSKKKQSVVTGSNGMLQDKSEGLQNKQDSNEKQPIVTRSNGVMPRQIQEIQQSKEQVFTVDQVDILHKMINEYLVRQQIQAGSEVDKGKTINRNVRVYEKQFEQFANWCKVNNVTQADALYRAIELLINNRS